MQVFYLVTRLTIRRQVYGLLTALYLPWLTPGQRILNPRHTSKLHLSRLAMFRGIFARSQDIDCLCWWALPSFAARLLGLPMAVFEARERGSRRCLCHCTLGLKRTIKSTEPSDRNAPFFNKPWHVSHERIVVSFGNCSCSC